MGQDGLLHCSVCGDAVQCRPGSPYLPPVVNCICSCRKKQLEAEEQVEQAYRRARRREQNRRSCFEKPVMQDWTFEAADAQQSKAACQLQKYAENFAQHRQTGDGLILLGPMGIGKSYLAAAVANRLLAQDFTVRFITLGRFIMRLQAADFTKREHMLQELLRCDLLIIDDLGTQRDTGYMAEQLFTIVDERYLARRPILVTTNLSWQQLSGAQLDETGPSARVYDRLVERCTPIYVTGESRRRQAARARLERGKSK